MAFGVTAIACRLFDIAELAKAASLWRELPRAGVTPGRLVTAPSNAAAFSVHRWISRSIRFGYKWMAPISGVARQIKCSAVRRTP